MQDAPRAVSRLYQHSPRQLRIARERLDKATSELQVLVLTVTPFFVMARLPNPATFDDYNIAVYMARIIGEKVQSDLPHPHDSVEFLLIAMMNYATLPTSQPVREAANPATFGRARSEVEVSQCLSAFQIGAMTPHARSLRN